MLLAAVAVWLLPVCPAAADTFLPTRHDDPTPGRCKPTDCSLREAILAANRHGGADAVDLMAGPEPYELAIPGAAEQEDLRGDLDVTDRLTIEAVKPGRATIDANGIDRVLEVFKATTIDRLVLTGGDVGKEPVGRGGGIEASAPTEIVDSTLSENTGRGAALNAGGTVFRSTVSDNLGGGVLALAGRLLLQRSTVEGNVGADLGTREGAGVLAGEATIDRSQIIDNATPGSCGGARLGGDGRVTVEDSVFDGNTADGAGGGLCVVNGTGSVEIADSGFTANSAAEDGGGLLLLGAALKLTGSTIDHNRARGSGGGIRLDTGATLDLVNSTIADNDAAADGGGIDAGDGINNAHLRFSTIAGNLADSDAIGGGSGGGISAQNAAYDLVHGTLLALNGVVAPGPIFVPNDCDTQVTSTGRNLVDVSAGCDGFTGPGDLLDVDPLLGDLGANGGPTETIPLLSGSPAIDAGGSSGPATDQRGVPRPQGPRNDIGAFELQR